MSQAEEKLAAYVKKLAMKISRLRMRYFAAHVKVDGIWIDKPVPEKVQSQHDRMFAYYVDLQGTLDALREGNHPKPQTVAKKAVSRKRPAGKRGKMVMGNVFDM